MKSERRNNARHRNLSRRRIFYLLHVPGVDFDDCKVDDFNDSFDVYNSFARAAMYSIVMIN